MRMNLVMHARATMVGAACLGALAAVACKERTNAADTARVEAPATADSAAGMAPADNSNALTNNPTYTDANIVALLDEANKADSAAGAFALGKAADPGVKEFAKMMMGEHHALRVQGKALAKKLNITPEPPTQDPVQTAGTSEMEALRSAGKGAAFDRVYIDQEVSIHKAVLDLADKAHGDTKNEELRALIEKAKPTIEKHRDRAEELQKALGKPTS